jgi:ATP-dependent helicase/nuclease subunit B
VKPETILKNGKDPVTAPDLAGEAWARTEKLLAFYLAAHNGYKSRVIPFREGEAGEYDHLARVLEWSAGVEGDEGGEE